VVEVRYRRPGQPGSSIPALIASDTRDPAALLSRLEAVVGPVVHERFEVVPDPEAPPPDPPRPSAQPGPEPAVFREEDHTMTFVPDEPEALVAAPEPLRPVPAPAAPPVTLVALRGRLMAASDRLEALRPPRLWGDATDYARLLAWQDRREAMGRAPTPSAGHGGGFGLGQHPHAPSRD
jgi:hypothetical protein